MIKNSVYKFEPDNWQKGVQGPPTLKPKQKKRLKSSIKFKSNKGCLKFDHHPTIPRQKNHSIFGNNSKNFENFLYYDQMDSKPKRSRAMSAKNSNFLREKNEVKNLADFSDKKSGLEQFGFVQREGVNLGDTFVNQFLRGKAKYDRVKKQKKIPYKFRGNWNDQFEAPKVSGLKRVRDPAVPDLVENQYKEKNEFCNFQLDDRFLTEEEKRTGIVKGCEDGDEIRGNERRVNDKGKVVDVRDFLMNNFINKNFVVSTANKIEEDAGWKKVKARKIMEADVKKMRMQKMKLGPKYQRIAEEMDKREREERKDKAKKKSKLLKKVRKNYEEAIERQAERVLLQPDLAEEREILAKAQKIRAQRKSDVLKSINSMVDIPEMYQSIHLKNAIKNSQAKVKKYPKNRRPKTVLNEFQREEKIRQSEAKTDMMMSIATRGVLKECSEFEEDSVESITVRNLTNW